MEWWTRRRFAMARRARRRCAVAWQGGGLQFGQGSFDASPTFRVGHFFDGGKRLAEARGQEFGKSKEVSSRLEIGMIWKVRVWMRDAFGSEVGGERLKKSDKEVLPDPLQRIQTREPLEHAVVP